MRTHAVQLGFFSGPNCAYTVEHRTVCHLLFVTHDSGFAMAAEDIESCLILDVSRILLLPFSNESGSIASLYSLAFLSPPAIKKRVKEDRVLRFPKIMLRLIKKLVGIQRELRHHFMVSVRRAVEAVKLIDDGEDSFDTTNSSVMPTLSFGMGYGEHGEARMEKGMGILSGYQEDITMGVMMTQELDDMLFSELSSLVRVGP